MGYQVRIEGWGQPVSPELQTVSPESSYWHGDFYRVRRFDGKFLTLGHVKRKRHSDRFVAYSKEEESQIFSPFDDTETKEEAKKMVEIHFGHWPPKFSQSEKIEAAVAVLREEYDLASHISKYPNGFNGGRPTTESEDDLSDAVLKALAILEGRDQ